MIAVSPPKAQYSDRTTYLPKQAKGPFRPLRVPDQGRCVAGAAFGPSERQRIGSTHVDTVEDRRTAQSKGVPDLPDRVTR